MMTTLYGKKIGMTQLFSGDVVVPVTAIDLSNWIVTGFKRDDRDGYNAVVVGWVRKQFADKPFAAEWLKEPKKHFYVQREVQAVSLMDQVQVGQPINFVQLLESGKLVDVFGITKGHGFQGVVKRHGFAGGRASHGPRFGRIPGSLGFMRSQGRVIKGKKLPGHMGCDSAVMRNLPVVRLDPESQVVFVKGSVPGASGSLVMLRTV